MEGEWQGLVENSKGCEELDIPMPGGDRTLTSRLWVEKESWTNDIDVQICQIHSSLGQTLQWAEGSREKRN